MNKGWSLRQIIEKSATLYWKLIHLYLPCFSFRVCSSTVAMRLAAWHVLACLNRTSKDTGPWRIESWGHELHSYPHKDKPSVSAPLKTDKESSIEILWNAKGWGNQMPIDFNASPVRNDFLQQNGWRLEKWVLKPGLWEIKGPQCSVGSHTHAHTHTRFEGCCMLFTVCWRKIERQESTDGGRQKYNGYTCCIYCTHPVTCCVVHSGLGFIQLQLFTGAFHNHRLSLSCCNRYQVHLTLWLSQVTSDTGKKMYASSNSCKPTANPDK